VQEDRGSFFVNTEGEKKGRKEEKKRRRDGWCVERAFPLNKFVDK